MRANTASSNLGEGIEVADFAPSGQGNLVERNTANGNGGDGLIVEGSGHTITGNVANLNGGFGMFVVPGNADGGGNQATGNVEPQQCEGVVCTIGEAPGAPQTILLEGPPAVSDSHTAAFYYTAEDDSTALIDITFECRIDTTDPLQWEDCEYPAIYSNLSPGRAHRRDPRHRHQRARRLDADQRHLDLRPPAGRSGPGHHHPARSRRRRRRCSTPCSRSPRTSPDTTFECQVDTLGWQPCGQEQPPELILDYSFYEAEFEEFEVGPHTFRVRAIDIEGLPDPTPAEYTWVISGGSADDDPQRSRRRAVVRDRRAAQRRPDPRDDGHVHVRIGQRPGLDLRVLARPRPVRAVQHAGRRTGRARCARSRTTT